MAWIGFTSYVQPFNSCINESVLPNEIFPYKYLKMHLHSVQWASCQICQIPGCACTGNAGNVLPATAGKQSRHASRHVHDARAVMHATIANWRFPLNSAAGENIPCACATCNFTYLVRGPWHYIMNCYIYMTLLWIFVPVYQFLLSIPAQLILLPSFPLWNIVPWRILSYKKP